jgi:S-formylglutathione hydrolase FrmB
MCRYFLILLLMHFDCAAWAAGAVEICQFFSPSLNEGRDVSVYLPEGYDPDGIDRYPVIYFLHGANCTFTVCYEYLISILDDLIGTGAIRPIIMVRPDGYGCAWGGVNGCSWVNSDLQGAFEDYVAYDVVAFADSTYRTIPNANRRALLGHSMGGFGVMHTALKHPDIFGAVAAHSGYLFFDDFEDLHVPMLIAEQSGPAPWEWYPQPVFTQLWFLFAGGFSPHPGQYPYEVDFPLDEWGVIIPEVWIRWLEHDPARLAAELTPETAPAIYFDCGTNDELLFHQMNDHFHQYISGLGIPHEAQLYVGGHYQQLESRFPISLQFLDDAMNDLASAENARVTSPAKIMRIESGPGFSGPVEVVLTLPQERHVSLRVYDVAGRLVSVLLNRVMSPGESRLSWNVAGHSSGVYFCSLHSGSYQESLILTLIQ